MTRRTSRPSNRDDSPRPRRSRSANGIPYPGAPDPADSRERSRPDAKTTKHVNRTRTLAPIPPTVWTAGPNPIDPAVTWPAPIIEAITTSFSRPGDCVVLAPWPAHAAETRGLAGDGALTGARDAVRALGRNAIVEELAPTSSSVAGTAEVAEDRAESGDGARLGAMAADRANLVIASMPPERGTDGSAEVLALAAARALAFGGVLAVYTHSDWSTGRLIHPSGPMIVAAQNADLLYLQHIVTVLTPIHGGRLQPMPEPLRQVSNEAALSAQLVGSATTGHARVHGDVLVFAQAHTAIAHPEDLR